MEQFEGHFDAPKIEVGVADTILPFDFSDPISRRGFFHPNGLGSVQEAQHLLTKAVEVGYGEKSAPGIVSAVLWWNGHYLNIGAFDARTGQQVGIGQAARRIDPRAEQEGVMLFETCLAVADQHIGMELSFIMRVHIEAFICHHISAQEIYILDEVTANWGAPRDAVIALLTKVNSKPRGNPWLSEMYIKKITRAEQPDLGEVLRINSIELRETRTHQQKQFLLPEGVRADGFSFFAGNTEIARFEEGLMRFTQESETCIAESFSLWRAAKRAGFSMLISAPNNA